MGSAAQYKGILLRPGIVQIGIFLDSNLRAYFLRQPFFGRSKNDLSSIIPLFAEVRPRHKKRPLKDRCAVDRSYGNMKSVLRIFRRYSSAGNDLFR
jgi:hypothetical protein